MHWKCVVCERVRSLFSNFDCGLCFFGEISLTVFIFLAVLVRHFQFLLCSTLENGSLPWTTMSGMWLYGAPKERVYLLPILWCLSPVFPLVERFDTVKFGIFQRK